MTQNVATPERRASRQPMFRGRPRVGDPAVAMDAGALTGPPKSGPHDHQTGSRHHQVAARASRTARGHTREVSSSPDLLGRIQAARRRLAVSGPSAIRSARDFERVSVPDKDGDVLRDLLLAEKPKTVIEVGLAYGSSALAIAEALVGSGPHDVRYVIIDAYEAQFQHAGWDAMSEAGLSDICSLTEERSQLALPRLLAEGFVADAAFVDGSHVFHNVFVDLFFLRELVRPGGLVVLDDCEWPSVATAARYFELNTGWCLEPIDRMTRLRAYRLPATRLEPNFEDFQPFGFDD